VDESGNLEDTECDNSLSSGQCFLTDRWDRIEVTALNLASEGKYKPLLQDVGVPSHI
jgi:hypothetical protein